MSLIPMFAAALACLALAGLFGWLGARPPDPRRGPRLVPWRFLMLLAFSGFVVALAFAAAIVRGEPSR